MNDRSRHGAREMTFTVNVGAARRALPGVMVDERLVRLADAARSGGQAEGTALAEVEPLLRRWAARLLNDAGALDDVVQESLTEIYTTIGALRDPAAIRTWLWLCASTPNASAVAGDPPCCSTW